MTSDSGYGITAITYNDFGLPVKFHTQDRKTYTAYSYSADGALLQKEVSTSTSSPFPFTSKSETTYSAGRIFYSGTRSKPLGTYVSYFPGGYFDSNGGVHYMHLDYQGSVVMETDSAGHIEKHRGYYPYGEPWAESTNKKTLAASVAQPQTYQSKERTAATGDYDFGPRRYISAAPFWRAPDPKVHEMPGVSPYIFCLANPIRYTDLTGFKPSPYEAALMSAAVYKDDDYSDFIKDLNDLKWVISDHKTDIQKNHHAYTGIGLQSMLFQRTNDDGKTEYAYVYAGTNSWEDGVEDVLQVAGLAPQYAKAIENAKTLHEEIGGDELTFVGHSLGGGEAAAASMATGRDAITFNPAVVSGLTSLFNGLGEGGNIDNYISATPKVLGLSISVDPVTNFQRSAFMTPKGNIIHVPTAFYPTHSINRLVRSLKP